MVRNKFLRFLIVPFAAIALAAGCTQDATHPVSASEGLGVTDTDSRLSVALDDDLQNLTQAIAVALGDHGVRMSVISGMRDSPHAEHKVVLNSFLQSAQGARLVESIRVNGATDELIAAVNEDFPTGLDFYLPAGTQRRAWTGSGDILVAGVADLDAEQAVAYDTEGQPHVISGTDVSGYSAVVVLHPAEPKFARRAPSGVETIEATSSAVATVTNPSMHAVCDPEFQDCDGGDPPGGGGDPPPSSPSTRVTSVLPDFDDGPFGGNVELYFITAEVGNPPSTYESAKIEAIPYVNNGPYNLKIFNDAAFVVSGTDG